MTLSRTEHVTGLGSYYGLRHPQFLRPRYLLFRGGIVNLRARNALLKEAENDTTKNDKIASSGGL